MKRFYLIIACFLFLFTQCATERPCACGDHCVTLSQAVFEGEIGDIFEEEEEIVIVIEEEPEEDITIFIADPTVGLPVTEFREIWGYVIAGAESALMRGMPITDAAHFGAEVNQYGILSNVPNRRNLSFFTGRVHLTVTCPNNALTYFTLMPGSQQRSDLIRDLIAATASYDGLNIDFENIPARSGEAFLSFLRELREGLPGKMLTIALYGRTRAIAGDVYDYATIAPLVDRIFVMAYDEHWGGSNPGPVSTLRWCRSVAEYSVRVAGRDKIIMGIPFYGRAWSSANHSRALTYSGIDRVLNTTNPTNIRREDGTPAFDYSADVYVRVYYEDEYSISQRLVMYKSLGVEAVGFWRVGQETSRVWSTMRVSGN
ncbi:MAG: glycosyl hydrolase family 18 protein [Treponema sp.]|nr:glycosyl hydrolase family 18 protein [Treponema sp.]